MNCQYCSLDTAGSHISSCPNVISNKDFKGYIDAPINAKNIKTLDLMDEISNPRIATTGHRTISNKEYLEFQAERFVIAMKDRNVSGIYIGGAKGWDSFVAKFCYLHGVRYHLYFAYSYQVHEFINTLIGKRIYDSASGGYVHKAEFEGNHIYQERNIIMVDKADEVHSFYKEGLKGGTLNTIRYAEKINKPVINWY